MPDREPPVLADLPRLCEWGWCGRAAQTWKWSEDDEEWMGTCAVCALDVEDARPGGGILSGMESATRQVFGTCGICGASLRGEARAEGEELVLIVSSMSGCRHVGRGVRKVELSNVAIQDARPDEGAHDIRG